MQPSIRGTPPQYTSKNHLEPAKNSPCHPQSTEPQQGTRASHSVARHAQHRGSTPKTVQNIRPAAAKEKSDQDRKLGPATVASLINTQPTQRLHHQATGPRGNIFYSPVWSSYFFFFSLRTIVLPVLPSPSLLSPLIPTRAPQTYEETTYKHHQPGSPRFLTTTTISRAPPLFQHRAYGGRELSGGGCRPRRRLPRSVLLRFDILVSSLSTLERNALCDTPVRPS